VYPRSPDTGLAPSLARGPTPVGPSFRVTRTPVAIASAKAGGNAAKIALAYDDNEDTTWTNGDAPDSAWAEFTLARPARLTEITAKLPGWRSRSYPILVTLDGVPVYRGATSPNLGYVTLPLKAAAAGQVVRVQLTGKGETNIGFGEITEVANAKNASDGAPAAKGSLGIVEIEFYEAAPAAP